MLDSRLAWLGRADNARLIRRGLRGVEKETLRVDAAGELSHRPHPRALGSALTHPYLTTDYSEALLEFVTPPHPTSAETLDFLADLHGFVHSRLGDERLWPPSMPCVLNADEAVPIAEYGTSNQGLLRTVYRRGLGVRYGRAMQAIAGAHFNYSPPESFWPAFREHCASSLAPDAFAADAFMGLVRNYRRNAWLVLYLFGESPAFCKSFRPAGHPRLRDLGGHTWYAPHATSLRMSDLGYRNTTQARLRVSANSLAEYVADLKTLITTPEPRYDALGVVVDGDYVQLNANVLQIENEYYSSIRPKPARRGLRPVKALERQGIEYVELRTLDLDSREPLGMSRARMHLLETLAVHCLLDASPPISVEEQDEIDARELVVAWEGRRPGLEIVWERRMTGLRERALELVAELAEVAAILDASGAEHVRAVDDARAAVLDPELTPSAELLRTLRDRRQSFFEYGRERAAQGRQYFLERGLDAATRDHLAEVAERSLAETAALEAEPQAPFAEFLREYLAV